MVITMAKVYGTESLFKEHSFEEIESVRDNLASEIEKRTELLKSIVKEKYRDIVETSDAIQSMKLNLKEVEQSLWSLNKDISEFYIRIREPKTEASKVGRLLKENQEITESSDTFTNNELIGEPDIVNKLLKCSSELWACFESGDLKTSVRLLNTSRRYLEAMPAYSDHNQQAVIDNLRETLDRTSDMIKNSLWHKIQGAAPDQLGIITDSDQEDLFKLGLSSSMKFMVETLRKELSDTSYHAQIRRYQPQSYFNSLTNQVETNIDLTTSTTSGLVPLPKLLSPELDTFLYDVCRVVNTIAGFNLNRSSIIDSLRVTVTKILEVYASVVPLINSLKAESRRKRALQLYFDTLYVRIVLNTSKNIELIDELDPKVTELASKFEQMLDSIELYMISAALHANAISLSRSTIRLYGLLVPRLQ